MRSSVSFLIASVLFLPGPSAAAAQPEKPAAVMTSTGDLEIGGKTLDQWVKATKNPDPAVRENAVRMIGHFPEPDKKKAIPALIPRLRDVEPVRNWTSDAGVCGTTIVTLQTIRLDPAEIGQEDFDKLVNGLVYNLQQGTMYARLQAAACLGNIGPLAAKNAIPPLVSELKTKLSWEVRKACAYALGRVGYNPKDGPEMRVVGPLLAALNDDSAEVRLQALSSLDTLGFPKDSNEKLRVKRALDQVTQKERNKVIQIWAHVLLVRLVSDGGEKRVLRNHIESIAKQLQTDPDPQNRAHAAAALGRIGAEAKDNAAAAEVNGKIPLLIATIKDPQPAVAGAAVGSLGLLKAHVDEKDVRALIKYLAPTESPEIRALAAQALGVIGVRSRIPMLIDLLKDSDEPVADAAAGALAQMKDSLSKDQLDAISKMLSDPKEKLMIRCRAAAALGAIGQKSKIPVLVEALRDKDSFVASSAVSALAAMKDRLSASDVAATKNLAFDKDKPPETRCHAITLLGMLGGKAKIHVPDLIVLLKEKETPIVLCAVMALARMGKDAQAALPELAELKKHRETYVREAAAKAIEEISKPEKDSKAAAK